MIVAGAELLRAMPASYLLYALDRVFGVFACSLRISLRIHHQERTPRLTLPVHVAFAWTLLRASFLGGPRLSEVSPLIAP